MSGDELRRHRERLGVSQAHIGAALVPPVSNRRVHNLEAGHAPITERMAARLADALRRLEAEQEREELARRVGHVVLDCLEGARAQGPTA